MIAATIESCSIDGKLTGEGLYTIRAGEASRRFCAAPRLGDVEVETIGGIGLKGADLEKGQVVMLKAGASKLGPFKVTLVKVEEDNKPGQSPGGAAAKAA